MEPLTWDHVSQAQKVMLPTTVGFFAVIGLNYLFTSHGVLLATPSLAYANSIMPIEVWGLVFLGAAWMMLTSIFTQKRSLYRYALLLCSLSMAVWSAVDVCAIFWGHTSYGAWAYPAFVSITCYALYRSLRAQRKA